MSKPVDHKYRWLLNQLMHKKLTRKEITNLWRQEEGVEISRETFINWKNAVELYYKTVIQCDTSSGYRYYITEEDKEKIKGNQINNWVLKTMEVSDTVAKHTHLKDRILVEEVPSGNEALKAILDAMEGNYVVSFEYIKNFDNPKDESFVYELCPYCVKQFERRWYVVGFCFTRKNTRTSFIEDIHDMRTFSIDKIQKLEQMKKTFELPNSFDGEEYFKPFFGIITGVNDARMGKINFEHIEIKVDKDRAKYFRSLPLHHTQHEKKRTEEYAIFTYDLYPTNDFYQALLHHGPHVEVLAPESARNKMKELIREMAEKYK